MASPVMIFLSIGVVFYAPVVPPKVQKLFRRGIRGGWAADPMEKSTGFLPVFPHRRFHFHNLLDFRPFGEVGRYRHRPK
jgi:hypothetical protein